MIEITETWFGILIALSIIGIGCLLQVARELWYSDKDKVRK